MIGQLLRRYKQQTFGISSLVDGWAFQALQELDTPVRVHSFEERANKTKNGAEED